MTLGLSLNSVMRGRRGMTMVDEGRVRCKRVTEKSHFGKDGRSQTLKAWWEVSRRCLLFLIYSYSCFPARAHHSILHHHRPLPPFSRRDIDSTHPVERQDTCTGLHAYLHLIIIASTRSQLHIMSAPSPPNGDAKTHGEHNNFDAILDNDLDAMIANSISQPNSIPPPSPTPGSSDIASSGPTLSSLQEPSPQEPSWSPSQPQHQDDLASSIRPNSSLFQPPIQQHQPGMSPAIQKRGPSLGLALGGSSFRRKPLFGPDDDDNDNGDRSDPQNKVIKGKGKKDKTLQDLTQSPDDDPEHFGERRDGEEDHNDEEEEEEEDANSETPLHPQETIRGLE